MLQIKNISKYYSGHKALDDVSIEIPKGVVFGLLGPNGAGKTSLIRILNQIILAEEGEVYFDGEKLNESHIAQIGYLPEERGLYKSMKVGEQVLYLARLKGMSKRAATERARVWFQKFGITDWWHKKIQELSKGMAQKVQFIVTVLHEPKLLIFDEPFSGFDPVNATLIAKEIIALKEKGTTVIFSTHRMESVEEMCDYICLINQSKKILSGSITEVRKQFKSNKFEIGIQTTDKVTLKNYMKAHYDYEEGLFETMYDDEKYLVDLTQAGTTTKILNDLLRLGTITHFVEQVPTMNSIFIKAVAANS